MYYAFDLNDTYRLDNYTMDNIDIISMVAFDTIERLEKFLDINYSYIGVYDHEEKYPTPVNFKSRKEAQIELIKCLNKEDKHGRIY